MNSFIRTSTGLSMVINNQPYNIESSHQNYENVKIALRDKHWNTIPDMINMASAVRRYVAASLPTNSDLQVDVNNNTVTFRGDELPGVLVQHVLDMAADHFDVLPMARFLANLYENPSNRAVTELYGWIVKNGVTITDDGFLLAYKRVNDNFKSFHDGTTDNSVGTTPTLPRNKVDDRSDATCSYGLHFCSQAYLPQYCGGRGKVLLLKIHPRDVVSIPNDYNWAKGRACAYLVLAELVNDARVDVEKRDVMPQPVVISAADVNQSNHYKTGYAAGYKDGRGKKAARTSVDYTSCRVGGLDQEEQAHIDYDAGYDTGRKDGRDKKPNLFGSGVAGTVIATVVVPFDDLRDRVIHTISEQTGWPLSPSGGVTLNFTRNDLGMDSLDETETAVALEDEFGIELQDDELERCINVADVVNLVRDKVNAK